MWPFKHFYDQLHTGIFYFNKFGEKSSSHYIGNQWLEQYHFTWWWLMRSPYSHLHAADITLGWVTHARCYDLLKQLIQLKLLPFTGQSRSDTWSSKHFYWHHNRIVKWHNNKNIIHLHNTFSFMCCSLKYQWHNFSIKVHAFDINIINY